MNVACGGAVGSFGPTPFVWQAKQVALPAWFAGIVFGTLAALVVAVVVAVVAAVVVCAFVVVVVVAVVVGLGLADVVSVVAGCAVVGLVVVAVVVRVGVVASDPFWHPKSPTTSNTPSVAASSTSTMVFMYVLPFLVLSDLDMPSRLSAL